MLELCHATTLEVGMAYERGRGIGYLEWPASLATGETSGISSASTWSVKFLGTCHIKILPSSEPDAMRWSLKGFLECVTNVG